jgi:hypothetical protein
METGHGRNCKVYEVGDKRIIYEKFSSIRRLLEDLDRRPNNEIMRKERESDKADPKDWYKTRNYAHAKKLIVEGYTEILKSLTSFIYKNTKFFKQASNKSSIMEDVLGSAPIIPNYLKGLPNNMFYRKPNSRKIKTLEIIYNMGANCGHDGIEWVKAGAALLSVIKFLERKGITVKLECIFMSANRYDEYIIGSVPLKDYKDRLDLQKLCFPLANPSMFRRFGFKFLETCPEMTKNFSFGYGGPTDTEELIKVLKVPEKSILMSMTDILEFKNDPIKLLNHINETIKDE